MRSFRKSWVQFLFLVVLLIQTSLADAAPGKPAEKPLVHGVNLGSWLGSLGSGVKSYDYERMPAKAFQNLAALGLDHVRIPVSPEFLFTDTTYAQFNTKNVLFLDKTIRTANQSGLTVILDLHPHSLEYKSTVDHIEDIWRMLAIHYKHFDNKLVLETLNEPKMDNLPDWYALQTRAVSSIRAIDSTHRVMVDSPYRGYYSGMAQIKPLNYSRLIYSFHYYNPMVFTHQGAVWAPPYGQLKNVPYPISFIEMLKLASTISSGIDLTGTLLKNPTDYNRQTLAREIAAANSFAVKYKLPVYCGEFGVYTKAPATDRIRWYKDMIDVLHQNHIGFALWDYLDENFRVDPEILTYMRQWRNTQ
jgi:aryl-phospho-beta-D-glucosidase BglC (GH1 family)